MKGNEMLSLFLVWFQCYTGEGFRKRYDQENRKSRGVSNNING